LLLAVGAYAIFSVNSNRAVVQPASPVTVADAVKVARVARSAERIRAHLPARALPHDRLVVVHNVVTLKRAPVAPPPAPVAARPSVRHASQAAKPASEIADSTVAALSPSAREKRSIAALRTQQTAAPPAERAESLAVFPSSVSIRDVFPLGGENAIVPRPAPIAYSENATGTTAFEVNVDERGVPVRCTITKASGYLVLDEAVCRAAMRARYSPRTIDGRPVQSLYRDAFTFRTGDEP
jgi:TonB family protein